MDELFREAHSMKGMSASMGFVQISTLSHRLEDFLDKLRKGTISVTKEVVDLLFEGFDLLRNSIEEVREKGTSDSGWLRFHRRSCRGYQQEGQESGASSVPDLRNTDRLAGHFDPSAARGEEEDQIQQIQRWAKERGFRLYSITVRGGKRCHYAQCPSSGDLQEGRGLWERSSRCLPLWRIYRGGISRVFSPYCWHR